MASEQSSLAGDVQGTEHTDETVETLIAAAEKDKGTGKGGKGKKVVTEKRQEEKIKKLTQLADNKINTEDLIYLKISFYPHKGHRTVCSTILY